MAIVPPTLPPNPRPAGGEHREHARPRPRQHRGPPGRRGTCAAATRPASAAAEQRRDAVDAQRLVADAVEPARLEHRQPERRLQLQPRPGHHVEPSTSRVNRQISAERRERVPPPRPGQRGQRDDQRPGRGHPVQPAAGWASCHHGTRLARNVPAGTAAANTPATRHPRARRLRRSAAAPQQASPIAASTRRVGQRVGPEERAVRGRPHLFGGVPADQRPDRRRPGRPGRRG